ncbi:MULTISPECIES: KH domain-containing protein [Loigolactobacillus]|uniref:RNA-binding protein KhpA n=1 Tax=Loigolactobacillus backii TaxID=375175 RepID=A0A192H2I0_9LACO|nr:MULTISPECIES: KH domain-containing protein [Loigolactobacillus]ANK59403.1 RNA-binding protein [Loigolactobacillus backii]ANK63019.1 RNA-binding protein [Loigolactobacillus backii]ANK64397.1 RNA-binding protein [Loigolactobacillus backii]ANK67209.1 RNA-binding protein [Loigolactobacillus backii]ANK69973.1 RNA-binding protein [Loigolactobacillus backii]
MTDVKELIKTIVQPLVTQPDDIEIVEHETERFVEYDLHVNHDDIGRIIGKQGRVAQAIRTIVYSVKVPGNKRVRLNIIE